MLTAIEGLGELIPWDEYQATSEDRQTMAARGAMIRLRPGKVRIQFEAKQFEANGDWLLLPSQEMTCQPSPSAKDACPSLPQTTSAGASPAANFKLHQA